MDSATFLPSPVFTICFLSEKQTKNEKHLDFKRIPSAMLAQMAAMKNLQRLPGTEQALSLSVLT